MAVEDPEIYSRFQDNMAKNFPKRSMLSIDETDESVLNVSANAPSKSPRVLHRHSKKLSKDKSCSI